MDTVRQVTRRAAIKDMGKAGLAVMVFGTACTGEPASRSTTTSPNATSTSLGSSTTVTKSESTTTPPETPTTEWARVQMAIVSAYILYRGGEAALVDTGQAGSAPSIQAALTDVGLNWGAIGHVILTHRHPDHIGSAAAVAALAPDSIFYIGEGDADAVADLGEDGPTLATDGDDIFGMRIISTPGHTPGHISVLDESAGVLVAGDAMNHADGALTGSNPSFTADEAAANESIGKLAGFDFETILFGHSDPILSGGSAEVEALATSLNG
jgi:glyoxylase-like metal-dependent hydrolase (beta-lactamase superfamily II)